MIVFVETDVVTRMLEQLDEQCYQTMRHSYRTSTMKNYRSQALIYHRFCEFYGLRMFPADTWQMVRYARYIANTVTSYETVLQYVGGVRRLHKLAGIPVPGPEDPNLQHILRGIKYELAHAVKQAKPITPDILRDIYNHVQLQNVFEIVCYTALLLGFYMFLRKSNLVPDTTRSFNSKEQLTRSDVRTHQNLVAVEVKWSKTHQFKQKQLLLPLIPAKDIRVCPLFWLKLMFKKVKAKPGEPLLSVPQGTGVVPVTYDQLGKQLKHWVERTGRNPEGYTLHGLRRGGASWALESGIVGEDLKLMGDWATDTYMKYLDSTFQRRVKNMVQFMSNV